MNIYYKYSDLMDNDFFENPTVKISVPTHLNDPYESQPSEEIIKAIEYATGQPCPEEFFHHIENMIGCNGIVSLSETQRNSLMWAHYGNNHRGMCIGFKKNFMKEINYNVRDDEKRFLYYCAPTLTPQKINYDNYRFDINKDFNEEDILRETFERHFYTKSDEWIYEKEHRCIVPYTYATHIIVKDTNETISFDINGNLFHASLATIIKKLTSDKSLIKTKKNGKYKINEEMLSLMQVINLARFQNITFTQEIDPKSITEIYFGCKANKERMKDIYHKIKNPNHPLNHVKLFHLSISKTRFELHQNELTDAFFNPGSAKAPTAPIT